MQLFKAVSVKSAGNVAVTEQNADLFETALEVMIGCRCQLFNVGGPRSTSNVHDFAGEHRKLADRRSSLLYIIVDLNRNLLANANRSCFQTVSVKM